MPLFFKFGKRLILITCSIPSVLSRCPEDPSKTRIAIVAHANPGGGLPEWATKTAVNAMAPIEPFKLFHRINERVTYAQPQLKERIEEEAETMTSTRSSRPGGISQLGYACFWPQGGGKVESDIPLQQPSDMPINPENTDAEMKSVEEITNKAEPYIDDNIPDESSIQYDMETTRD